MERANWLKHMRARAEALYDKLAPAYWVKYGFYDNETHLQFLARFLAQVGPGEEVLDAGCGAGRYDGVLAEAGLRVLGIDISERMLARAREHFPQDSYPGLRYEKLSLQEMDFREQFDGAICMDTMEHIPPEDWPGIVACFARALKPGGWLCLTVEVADAEEVRASFKCARAKGLPVVLGEMADEVDEAYAEIAGLAWQDIPDDRADVAVYHYYPPLEQARAWFAQAGFSVVEEAVAGWYAHFLVKKGA